MHCTQWPDHHLNLVTATLMTLHCEARRRHTSRCVHAYLLWHAAAYLACISAMYISQYTHNAVSEVMQITDTAAEELLHGVNLTALSPANKRIYFC